MSPLLVLVLLVLGVGIAILGIVAFLATQITAILSCSTLPKMLLPILRTGRVAVVAISTVLFLRVMLLVSLSPWIPFSLVTIPRLFVVVVARMSSLTLVMAILSSLGLILLSLNTFFFLGLIKLNTMFPILSYPIFCSNCSTNTIRYNHGQIGSTVNHYCKVRSEHFQHLLNLISFWSNKIRA